MVGLDKDTVVDASARWRPKMPARWRSRCGRFRIRASLAYIDARTTCRCGHSSGRKGPPFPSTAATKTGATLLLGVKQRPDVKLRLLSTRGHKSLACRQTHGSKVECAERCME